MYNKRLIAFGTAIVDWGEYSPVLGILNAAGIDPHSGERIATADPRDPDGTARGQ